MRRTQWHLKLRVDVNLTICLKFWLPLEENKCGPIFRKFLVTIDLVETRDISIQFANNTIRNPTIIFFDIFLLLRSTQEVTTGNLSLNKWKTWPVEFFEDCEKYEKNLGGENSNFRGEFGDSKIVEPAVGGIDRSKKIFWSILIYGTSKLEFVCESYGCFTNGLRNRGQNGPEVGKICDGG